MKRDFTMNMQKRKSDITILRMYTLLGGLGVIFGFFVAPLTGFPAISA